ncbi:riboflavin transporter 2-like [Haliotis cracherodii]|uniref:riboflavin transporter 2-like n=1 Tax=Haliotis cracherodii TaxID=6455 RepID=UPI0039E98BF0
MATRQGAAVLVYILMIMFGVSSWVDINGLWVELPIMVQELPEGWNLPSYIVVLTQLANIGPVIYSLLCSNRVSEKLVIYFIIGIGALTCLLLVFFWQTTTIVAGAPHSTAMFILNFILALVDCTSTVVFFPFMATFKPVYMSAYFSGEGLGGLLSGLLGLAQGAGRIVCLNVTEYVNATINTTESLEAVTTMRAIYEDNNFSFEVYFAIISGIIVMSGVAFTFLAFHPLCKEEHVQQTHKQTKKTSQERDSQASMELPADQRKCQIELTGYERKHPDEPVGIDIKNDTDGIKTSVVSEEGSTNMKDKTCDVKATTGTEYIISLLLTGWVNCLRNSALLAVQSYSCLPYGVTQYHLAVTLANLANPLACFFDLFIHVTSVPALSSLTLLGSLLGVYIMAAAVMSPVPVLVGTLAGSILIVSVWVVCVFILTYVKVSLASLFRAEGKKGLLHCGVATQVGSAIGGVSMFVFVNILNLFKTVDPCS